MFLRGAHIFLTWQCSNPNNAILLKQTNYHKDEYLIYLKFNEDETGVCTYQFEVLDYAAALYEQIMFAQGKETTQSLPKGSRITGQIIPGFISYQRFFGLGKRKLKKLVSSTSNILLY